MPPAASMSWATGGLESGNVSDAGDCETRSVGTADDTEDPTPAASAMPFEIGSFVVPGSLTSVGGQMLSGGDQCPSGLAELKKSSIVWDCAIDAGSARS